MPTHPVDAAMPAAAEPADGARLEVLPLVEHGVVERAYSVDLRAAFVTSFQLWRLPHVTAHLWFTQPVAGEAGELFVSGPTLQPMRVLHPRVDLHITGVQLTTGALGAILSVPAQRLANRTVPLAELWGEEARIVAAALSRAPDEAARRTLLSDVVVRRARSEGLGPAHSVHAALERMRGDNPSVEQLAGSLGISSRHLHRLFVGQVGCPPKDAQRILRLDRVLAALTLGERIAWSDLAAEQGFSDQSHLITDFRSLLGDSPQRFLARHGAGLRYLDSGWLFVPDPSPAGASLGELARAEKRRADRAAGRLPRG